MPLRAYRHRGFTLVEALLSTLVLSVGLLGAAAMLLGSLRVNAGALQRLAATQLLLDMADRIRANPPGRANYIVAGSGAASCGEPAGCDAAALAGADRWRFDSAARALFGSDLIESRVDYDPTAGPVAPERYVITLRWRDAGDVAESAALQVLAQSPVSG
jgi:type IV pilus assembly protein PilV